MKTGASGWCRSGVALGLAAMTLLGSATTQAGSGGFPGPSSGNFDPASSTEANHDIFPSTDFYPGSTCDENAIAGVSEHFIEPDFFVANGIVAPIVLGSGEFGIYPRIWTVADSYSDEIRSQLPADAAPLGATPLDDLLAKLTAIKMVVDEGTSNERSWTYTPAQNFVRTDLTLRDVFECYYNAFGFDAPPIKMMLSLTKLPPQRIGFHTVRAYWLLSAPHNDGFGLDPDYDFLYAGWNQWDLRHFQTTPGAAQSR
jgi:hypothetical protein